MTIEFIEDTHTYLCDGVIVPSVSELIRFKFPEAYKGIPDRILKKKANYGTKVHQKIEAFVNGEFTLEELQAKRIDPDIKIAVEQFEELRKKWCFQIKDTEQVVTYKGIYCGTYDLRTYDDYIIDLKTTKDLHEDWLAWQLGLYYLGAGLDREVGYVIWLPKSSAGKVKEIKVKSHDECKELLDAYSKATG